MSSTLSWSDETALANTLGLPASAARILKVAHGNDALAGLDLASQTSLPVLPLGQGSNVVLPHLLQRAVFVSTDRSVQVIDEDTDAVLLRVGAGKGWHELVLETVTNGWFGLENLALIPGTVGAAPIQNIGAYGVELSQFVRAVHGVDLQLAEKKSLSAEACEFAYRDSVFKNILRDRFFITSVDLRLSKLPRVDVSYPALKNALDGEAQPTSQQVCDAVVRIRQQRLPDPALQPNAGSFFKNPIVSPQVYAALRDEHSELPAFAQTNGDYKLAAAWLIERAGLRGFAAGRVAMGERHALVLINTGKAGQQDVLALAATVQQRIEALFDLHLEVEPRVYD